MSRTVCSAGVVKTLSYLIMPKGDGIIATVTTPNKEIVAHHTQMETAKSWLNKRIDEILKVNYEVE